MKLSLSVFAYKKFRENVKFWWNRYQGDSRETYLCWLRCSKGAKSKSKKKKKSKSKKSESLNDDDNKKPTEPVRKLTKPEGQVELTEEERKEEIQQVLTGDDPNLPRNVCKYSYKDRCFKLDPPGQSDHMAVHYADEGSSLHVESKEYRLQKELEDQKAEARKKKQGKLRRWINLSLFMRRQVQGL